MQTTLARRLGAGALALGLAAGLSACTGAQAAPRAADGTTSSTTTSKPAPPAEVDMKQVMHQASAARTTATIQVSTTGAKAGKGTVESDNRGTQRAVRGTASGTPLGDVQVMLIGEDVYAKLGGVDQFVKVPKDVLTAAGFVLGPGIAGSVAAAGGEEVAKTTMDKARLDRTETLGGAPMAVYRVQFDPASLPGASKEWGTSAVPVQVWLDEQQRPRKILAEKAGSGSAHMSLTAEITWGADMTITAPKDAQTLSVQDLLRLGGKLRQAAPSGAAV